ncbi:MAG: hypothetical protein NC033_00225 [Clostridiales bacterium]|nr:hypothetical protein [Clostridiales bacterium]
MYHKVKFKVKNDALSEEMANLHRNKITYVEDGLFGTRSQGGGFSLYLQDSYLCFDIDLDNKCLVDFSGLCSNNDIINAQLEFPKEIIDCIIYADISENLLKGCGWRISIKMNKCKYDKDKGVMWFGEVEIKQTSYRIFENLFIQLDDDNYLQGIIITYIK